MNNQINNIIIPHTQRTLGSEKALVSVNETLSGSLTVHDKQM